MRPEEVAACEAVRDTIARYAHAVDRGKFDDAAACFAEDGVLDVKDAGRHEGRDAIAAMFASAGRRLASSSENALVRHHVSSIRFESVARDTARVSSYFAVFTDVGLDHWGRYRDVLASFQGRWLFAHRRITVDGFAADSLMSAGPVRER